MDVSLPSRQYSEIYFNGQAGLARDESAYTMNSTERGIEIHYVEAPQQGK